NVELTVLGFGGTAVLELAGQSTDVEGALAPHQITCLACCQSSLRAGDRLVDDRLGLTRIALEPVSQPLVSLGLHERLRFAVAQFLLRLPLELWFRQFDRDDRRQPLANIVA